MYKMHFFACVQRALTVQRSETGSLVSARNSRICAFFYPTGCFYIHNGTQKSLVRPRTLEPGVDPAP